MKYFLLLFLIGLGFACKESTSSNSTSVKRAKIEFKKQAEMSLFNEEGEPLTQLDLELAETPYEQETGLMYREKMNDHQGMLFIYQDERPRPSFYMKNTKIALDLIYLDKNFKVVDFNLNARPLDEKLLSSKQPSMYVLEVNAGFVENHNVELGSIAEFKRL
ncbi:DUF192 domain-containing protein [Psychroflexus maritimus]|uniref:DUF192 domain-containing protein n=1 Tax=Psychroflexus maritimus TaxID=2714865 RepID=A0A967E685_9FLAO|nr:DUF192 domain-containing protein [Psychroflexus maritimus]NGZ89496.1 DUF192 domain-containing protein [Psychroflexus maritimus]